MFSVGDKIVYPMYGAGVLDNCLSKDVEGKTQVYYEMNFFNNNLKIVVSSEKAVQLGLRPICKADEAINAIKSVVAEPIEMPDDWNIRYKENMEKIKTGNLKLVALVTRNLSMREKERGLSGAEKKMLNNAKKIILSEIALSQDIEKERAEKVVKDVLSC